MTAQFLLMTISSQNNQYFYKISKKCHTNYMSLFRMLMSLSVHENKETFSNNKI
jgi:hypothetical protein